MPKDQITIEIQYHPSYFNRTAMATIPAYYRAEVAPQSQDDLEVETGTYDLLSSQTVMFYGDGQDADEAVETLMAQIHSRGWSPETVHRNDDYGTTAQ